MTAMAAKFREAAAAIEGILEINTICEAAEALLKRCQKKIGVTLQKEQGEKEKWLTMQRALQEAEKTCEGRFGFAVDYIGEYSRDSKTIPYMKLIENPGFFKKAAIELEQIPRFDSDMLLLDRHCNNLASGKDIVREATIKLIQTAMNTVPNDPDFRFLHRKGRLTLDKLITPSPP